MKLLDSHAHLSCDELYPHADEIIEYAMQAGIKRIMVICLNPKEFERALDLKIRYPKLLDISYGLFPTDLQDLSAQDWEDFYRITKHPDVKAIGEIGLDYYWDKEHKELQKEGFIKQINWASSLNKPIIVHSRDAAQDTVNIITTHLKGNGLMHCFSGSVDTCKQLLKAGMYISFAGPITFKNAKGLVEVPPVVPLDRILVETDSPYLTPHPFRGKRNEPKYVVHTFQKICELKGCSEEELSNAIFTNYHALFD